MLCPPYESLPPYSDDSPLYAASLEFYGVAFMKVEFDTPWNCRSGLLHPVVAELNLNQLRLYEFAADKSVLSVLQALFIYQNCDNGSCDNTDLIDGHAHDDDALADSSSTVVLKLRKHYSNRKIHGKLQQLPPGFSDNTFLLEPTANSRVYARFSLKYRGKLLHCFTLLHLAVGKAPSIHNSKEDGAKHNKITLLQYRNTLRLRIEHMQMLLHFWLFNGMVYWFRNLLIGRDLASSLDTRVVAKLMSIPRDFTSRNNAFLEAEQETATHRLFKPRLSVTSLESDLYESISSAGTSPRSSISSVGTSIGTSIGSSLCSVDNVNSANGTNVFSGDQSSILVYGNRVACYENMYTSAEKLYISNCIPTLNSFDKWTGHLMTLLNYQDLLPKNDANNINENGKIFISLHTFNNLMKKHLKHPRHQMTNKCKVFYVDDTGLVSADGMEVAC